MLEVFWISLFCSLIGVSAGYYMAKRYPEQRTHADIANHIAIGTLVSVAICLGTAIFIGAILLAVEGWRYENTLAPWDIAK